jgi:hypothetical protein
MPVVLTPKPILWAPRPNALQSRNKWRSPEETVVNEEFFILFFADIL